MWETLRFIYTTARLANLRKRQPKQVLALQQRRFRQILTYAAEHSPFYRRRFKGIDLRRCHPTDLPPLTKAEMMANFDELVTDRPIRKDDIARFLADLDNLGKLYLGKYTVCHTSGSQGQPSLIVQTPQNLMLAFAVQTARGHALPKRWSTFLSRLWNPNRMAIVTIRPGFFPSGVAFHYMPGSARRFTKLLRLSQLDSMADNVAKLNEFQPHILTAYASVLEMLAREERAGRLRLRAGGQLRQLTNISEPLTPESCRQIEQTFGVHLTDNYSMGECMALSFGCPFYSGAHLNADLAMLEVVDDEYRPVPDGTAGSRVLLTNLYNRVQPFIRYEITDIVTMSPTRCPCGSNLPLIQAIQGRTQDKFWIQDHRGYREVVPYIFQRALIHCLDLAEYQIVQVERNRFVIRGAAVPGFRLAPERLRSVVEQSLQEEGLSEVLEVEIEIVDEIRRDPRSGKMKRIQSLVGSPGEATAAEPTEAQQLVGAGR